MQSFPVVPTGSREPSRVVPPVPPLGGRERLLDNRRVVPESGLAQTPANDPIDVEKTAPPRRQLSAQARAVIIEALTSALVEDYLADQQRLIDGPGDSPSGDNRRPNRKGRAA